MCVGSRVIICDCHDNDVGDDDYGDEGLEDGCGDDFKELTSEVVSGRYEELEAGILVYNDFL